MKLLSHFKIENERQLELVFQDFKDDLPIDWKVMKKRFDSGTRILSKNSIGLIDFNDDILPQSKEIPNPYAERNNNGYKPSAKGLEQLKKDKALNDPRRKRIDDILKILKKDFKAEDVTLLLKVYDLEFAQNENVSLSEIYALNE